MQKSQTHTTCQNNAEVLIRSVKHEPNRTRYTQEWSISEAAWVTWVWAGASNDCSSCSSVSRCEQWNSTVYIVRVKFSINLTC